MRNLLILLIFIVAGCNGKPVTKNIVAKQEILSHGYSSYRLYADDGTHTIVTAPAYIRAIIPGQYTSTEWIKDY